MRRQILLYWRILPLINWKDSHIEVDPPKRAKKITGTRFGAILGLNPWSTPFASWCEITKTYQEPFVDTIYTQAGKVIEGKQIEYMRKAYAMRNLLTPTDVYGPDFFQRTYGDFFGDKKIFGGMWDSILVDENGVPEAVLEFKTTKRSEDWEQDIPEYYALQASLYAYLLGVDYVIMVGTFLEPSDYDHPEDFIPSAENTITRDFRVSERYPNFQQYINAATTWWEEHVLTGISPAYDPKKDEDILKELSKVTAAPGTEWDAVIAEAESLKDEIDIAKAAIAGKEKRYKQITDMLKQDSMSNFIPGIKNVEINGSRYTFSIKKSVKPVLDEDAIKADGLFDQYSVEKTTYTITAKLNKEAN